MGTYGKMDSYGNKYSLSDQVWKKVDKGFEVTSMFKMIPAMHALNPMKKYLIELNNGTSYKGFFRYYIYKKETIDSPLIRVYVEFKLEPGFITVPEDSIQSYVRI